MTTNALSGAYPISEGLRILFDSTGLEGAVGDRGQLIVRSSEPAGEPETGTKEMAAMPGPEGRAEPEAAGLPRDVALDEIVITGSRIRRLPGFTTAVPVTAVMREELMGFEPGGTMTEALDALPQFFQTETAQRGSGALFGNAGISTLNMRGMGAQRTLVLIDGARTAPRIGTVASTPTTFRARWCNGWT